MKSSLFTNTFPAPEKIQECSLINFFRPRGRACRVDRATPLTVESLDARLLLTAGPLGLNLTGAPEFVDAIKDSVGWSPVGTATSITRDANGWPTSDASVLVLDERVNQPWNGPDPNAVQPNIGGTYSLSFHGQAAVMPPGWLNIFTVQDQAYNPATNTTTAQVVVQDNPEAYLQINFTNTVNPASVTGAGVTDVRLIRPGYDPGTTQVFTTEYLNALAPFSTLRYLNLDGANNYGPTLGSNGLLQPLQWSQRLLPSADSQNDPYFGTGGQSWEDMIALANASNTDMWINIPGPATDDYVTQLANLIKNGDTVGGVTYAGLKPNLKVYVEYSNEVWGGISTPTQYELEAAKEAVAAGDTAINGDGTTDTYVWGQRYYLQREMQITNLFRGVLGADPTYSKIRPVLGWQEGDWQYYTQNLPWFEANYGVPSATFYGMGNANYFGVGDYSSVSAILNSLVAGEAQEIATTADYTAIARFYGLQTVAYEGGPALVANSEPAEQNALDADRNAEMATIVENYYLGWYSAGGGLAMFYNGPYATLTPQYGLWAAAELYQASNPSLSPKYQGLVALSNATPPAPSIGTQVAATSPTYLSSVDFLGQWDNEPHTGDANYWLLNVSQAGNYNLTMNTAPNPFDPASYAPGQVQVLLSDGTPLGTYPVSQNGTYSLGTVPLKAGLNTLVVRTIHGISDPSNPSNSHYFWFQPTGLLLTPTSTTPTQIVINDGGAGYSETPASAWQHWGGQGYNGDIEEAQPGDGSAQAAWSFAGLAPGNYQVSVTYSTYSNRATNAPYSIYDGSTLLGTVLVNQQVAPSGVVDASGNPWLPLGVVTITGSTLEVMLSNLANGRVEADAVRIVATSAAPTVLPPSPVVINNDGPGYSQAPASAWQLWTGQGYDGDIEEAMPGGGSAQATWSFAGLAPGNYQVSVTYSTYSNRATNAPYSIYDGSTLLGTVLVNQQVAPSGVVDASGNPWLPLGVVTITGSTLEVMLSNLANGRVEADAVRIVATSAAPTVLPPSPVVINNDGPGYSQAPASAWQLWTGQGYDGDVEEAQPGDGSAQATWAFAGLAPGNYQVSVTYPIYSNRATNAPYSIFDGTTLLGSVAVNQQVSPAGLVDASGNPWLPLGTFTITGSTLKVLLSNLANGRVEADAVRIVRV